MLSCGKDRRGAASPLHTRTYTSAHTRTDGRVAHPAQGKRNGNKVRQAAVERVVRVDEREKFVGERQRIRRERCQLSLDGVDGGVLVLVFVCVCVCGWVGGRK